MINNTDIFTRLDWLTNKVNRILGALQNGGGGGSQTLDQVLATGNTATNKSLLMNNSTIGFSLNSTPTMLIGNTSGYAGGIGFTITNDTGNSVSCDPTQYVINTSGVSNNITVDSITVNSTYPGSFAVALKFEPRYSTLYTEFGGYQVGLNLAPVLQTYTIGEELTGNKYFGIDTSNARLIGSGIHQNGAHFAPAGFVEILIDGAQYWIELWT